jgi:hypothetical protein
VSLYAPLKNNPATTLPEKAISISENLSAPNDPPVYRQATIFQAILSPCLVGRSDRLLSDKRSLISHFAVSNNNFFHMKFSLTSTKLRRIIKDLATDLSLTTLSRDGLHGITL